MCIAAQESLRFPDLNDLSRFLFLLFVSECILYSEFLEELKSGVYQAAKYTVSGGADCRDAPAYKHSAATAGSFQVCDLRAAWNVLQLLSRTCEFL